MWQILNLGHPQRMSVDTPDHTLAPLESRLSCMPVLDEQSFLLDEPVGGVKSGRERSTVTMES